MTAPKPKRTHAAPKPEATGAGVLFVRDAELSAQIDTWVERLNAAKPDGPQWNRATLVRAALRRALRERCARGAGP